MNLDFLRSSILTLAVLLHAGSGGCSMGSTITGENEPQRASPEETSELARLRASMVRDQLRGRDIRDARVLAAMLKIPRHEFVPPALLKSAYEDSALPLAFEQTVSQPYIVAYMTQALKLSGDERVLEIGTGSGYQAAVLAELAKEVYTIEILPRLSERSQSILGRLGYRNISFRVGDGYQGWPEHAPFDAIIVTAAPDHIPQPLLDQIKPGGRMIIPVGRFDQELVLVEKGPAGITRKSTIPVRFVPMTGKAQQGVEPRE